MGEKLLRLYDRLVLSHPLLALSATLLVCAFFVFFATDFKLDASADSLVLENDTSLRYHRQIAERYGTSDVLVLTYTPKTDLFAESSLADLKGLRDELAGIAGVSSVVTILDVPLLYSSGVTLGGLADEGKIKTLESGSVDLDAARSELRDSPLYRNRILSSDGQTTALLVSLPADDEYRRLLRRRYELREQEMDGVISAAGRDELSSVSKDFSARLTILTREQDRIVGSIRHIMDGHRGTAQLFVGGVPMIVSDMISFIENDLIVFSIGVFLFLLVTLTVIFRKPRWVILPMICCLAAGVTMIGYLGLVDWRVTVISSNFISLMLIFTMSLTIHLIVRYRELHALRPDADQKSLVLETVRLKTIPCLYTTLTTIVAFSSLLVSGIRPVMDFGLMMTIGLIVSFVLSFILFPAVAVMLKKGATESSRQSRQPFTLVFARLTEAHGGKILVVSLLFAVMSGVGISRLKVENRFIDYFREKTEIYQGMKVIDQKLGGTTPLDLIIDFREEETAAEVPDEPAPEGGDEGEDFSDLFDDLEEETEEQAWYVSSYKMQQMEKIHDYLEGLPEIGEVLSIATGMKIAERLNDGSALQNFEIALLHKKIPEPIRELLIRPYLSEEIPQARVTMRAMETDTKLQRKILLERMRTFLLDEMGFDDDQIHFTSMFVLYNNMLQSLFKSQILTIGMVFLGIMLMFTILFRSLYIAFIAVIPNLLPAAMILGTMGWLGIPLDMMTITIAAITIGIAVDDTIHYVHRFKKEFHVDRNYLAAVYRCHESIGRAMYYTSVTIIIGFSILVLSNFVPTVYFGLFTGLGMFIALAAALTLLPRLLVLIKPFGPEKKQEKSA